MTKVIISKKQIIKVREFMTNYIGVIPEKEKLSHKEMMEYLIDKNMELPTRINMDLVTKENLLNGTYIVVKDKFAQILIYRNPRLYDFDALLQELQSESNLKRLKKARKKIAKELGYTETKDGVFKQEDQEEQYPLEKENRQKKFIIHHKTMLRKRHY